MDAKDVKVGMKVVPHSKSGYGLSWKEFLLHPATKSFIDCGYMTVGEVSLSGIVLEFVGSEKRCSGFFASDFEPAEIEVGDTVRDLLRDGEECEIAEVSNDGKQVRLFYAGRKPQMSVWWGIDTVELVRKAKKPADGLTTSTIIFDELATEQKKEEKQMEWVPSVGETVSIPKPLIGGAYAVEPMRAFAGMDAKVSRVNTEGDGEWAVRLDIDRGMWWWRKHDIQKKEEPKMSKRPELSEINEKTLVKLREHGLCALMDCNEMTLCDKDCIENDGSAIAAIRRYDSNLKHCKYDEYDIVATKQMKRVPAVLSALLSNTEPTWDWREDDDKPEYKVGDWVEVSPGLYGGKTVGRRGQIAGKNDDFTWSVDFGAGYDGHDCDCLETDTGYWILEKYLKPCSPPEPVTVTAADLKKQYGPNVVLNLDGQTITVK